MKFSKTIQVLASIAFIGSIAQAQNGPIQAEAPAIPTAQVEPPNAPEKSQTVVAPPFAGETFEAMMGAIEDNNRAAFIAFADDDFKTALTPPVFQQVTKQVAPRLKGAHKFDYLGEINRSGYVVYLWRVRFADGGDDYLAQMSVKDDKVGGFLLS